MLITPHAVAGATIGALVPIRAVALSAAVSSHFLLDVVPHWQETLAPYTPHRGTWLRVPIDLALALAMTHVIARGSTSGRNVWGSALAAALPDIDFLWFLAPSAFERLGPVRIYVDWHVAIQRETSRLWGLAPQLAVIFGCVAVLRSGGVAHAAWRRHAG
jgi:hypothetical protein